MRGTEPELPLSSGLYIDKTPSFCGISTLGSPAVALASARYTVLKD